MEKYINEEMSAARLPLEKAVEKNKYYRAVYQTETHMQLVLMCLQPGEDIPLERHPKTNQFIRVESGVAHVVCNGKKHTLSAGDAIIIPEDTPHYVANDSAAPLKLYTIYTPPEHPPHHVDKRQP